MIDFKPIEQHPKNEDECILAIFGPDGLELADRGGWTPGEKYDHWVEVEDGLSMLMYTEEQEGSWWSNHCIEALSEPTHYAEIKAED